MTNQIGMVDFRQLIITERSLGEVAESVVCTLVGGAIGFQQREALNVLTAALRLHIDFQLAEVLLVLHIGDLKHMSTFGNEGEALGESDLSHCFCPPSWCRN